MLLDYSRVDFSITGGNRVGWIIAKKHLYLSINWGLDLLNFKLIRN